MTAMDNFQLPSRVNIAGAITTLNMAPSGMNAPVIPNAKERCFIGNHCMTSGTSPAMQKPTEHPCRIRMTATAT